MKCPKVSCVFALVILLSAVSSAFCAQVWTEQKITSGGTWGRYDPQIWGSEVYWTDGRSGQGQIYVWDQAGGERLLLGGTDSISVLAVYGNSLVVDHYVDHKDSLYLYDPVNGERLISATAGDSGHTPSAAIYGNTVVWEDMRSGVEQIYMWDPVNGERRIAPTSYAQTDPHIYGDTVTWTDMRNVDVFWNVTPRVYEWTPTGGERLIGSGPYQGEMESAIYGNTVWMSETSYQYGGPYKTSLYQWTEQGHLHYLTDLQADNSPISVSASLVAFGGMAWDPLNGVTRFSTTPSGYPSVYGRTVASTDGHDIYLSTLTPEPSSALALGLWSFGLAALLYLRGSARRKTVC